MVDGSKYEVGSYLPGRMEAENWTAFDTFNAAFQRIEDLLGENPQRKIRVRAFKISPEQAERFRPYRVERLFP